jgi:hypothetical protein
VYGENYRFHSDTEFEIYLKDKKLGVARVVMSQVGRLKDSYIFNTGICKIDSGMYPLRLFDELIKFYGGKEFWKGALTKMALVYLEWVEK